MKKYTKIMFLLIMLMIVFFVGINIVLSYFKETNNNNQYRVEINRIKQSIRAYEEQYGICPKNDAAFLQYNNETYNYIVDILCIPFNKNGTIDKAQLSKISNDMDKPYVLYQSNLGVYKISYTISYQFQIEKVRYFVNIILLFFALFMMAVLLYIRQNIMKPFNVLSSLPYELSKGNLSKPLKESKNKYFGHFLWGMDMLREKLEIDKQREFELVKDKKLLLISLSHDIKTPLSAIKLYAKALDKNLYKQEEQKHKAVLSISNHVDEIERYLSQIVIASSEEFINFDVDLKEVYVKTIINSIIKYYTEKLMLAQISFDVCLHDDCLIKGDEDRIIEILQNVIENAVKYGDGAFIRIDARRKGEEYIICITNSGCTLMEKELLHIFDSFFRGTNIDNKPGSGLGLYICRSLIHLMEGEIFADIITENDIRCMRVKLVFRLA